VIEDAGNDIRFSADPYIQTNKVKSILFIPIISQGVVIAALYLENNLLPGSFGPNRVELIRLLSGQIAISVENALLYENLEEKVEERTREINHQKQEIELQKQQIEIEKQKTDQLLLNILPEETAEELKKTGKAKARKYENVSVMFADIIAFTRLAEQLGPEELVSEIDNCFRAFDDILEKFNIEKIKTIGDAYMCAGGINNHYQESAANTVRAAMEMQKYMADLKRDRTGTRLPVFEIRIGIHTGSIVAGVVGSKKFAYDIWGDTVNMAARMEQSGEAGKVNISGTTFNLIKDQFICDYRGKVEAKNKGETDMYFIESEIVAEMAS
jgi:histidine kinase